MAAAFTPEQLAMIERQRAYFASDDLIRDRAGPWIGVSPEECWIEVQGMCEWAETCIENLSPETRDRALDREPLPVSTIALLEALQNR
ncbi:MAG TPA: hypothetical protein VIU61_07020 [Kofleriaceae bacterium]